MVFDMVRLEIVSVRKNERTWAAEKIYRAMNKAPRIYFWVENYNPIEEMRSGYRWNKPHIEYRRMLPEVFRQIDLPENLKVTWSQKAGCPCGCSPGFIITLPQPNWPRNTNPRFDVSVVYTYKEGEDL
jgi:hypothetical protein